MLDVVAAIAGDEVVDADDFVAALEEKLAEMRAEESGAAGDERAAHQTRSRVANVFARPTEM